MASNTTLIRAVKLALIAAGSYGVAAVAQDAEIEQVVVTGTRITLPGVESASPIFSVGAQEIALQNQPTVEKIVRILPAAVPGDGQNVNNGTDGAATIDLRGLGSQRNLILIDGHRLTPYNIFGVVDTSIIPTALIQRLDIITGGASAVYGSDAISGALNFILKDDFEGVEVDYTFQTTGKGDSDINTLNFTIGSNLADGRGNAVLGLSWSERDGTLLGSRSLGRVGITTSDGSGYQEWKDGVTPRQPPPGCTAPNAIASGGSGTTMPTRVGITGYADSNSQFRNDGIAWQPLLDVQLQPLQLVPDPAGEVGRRRARQLRDQRACRGVRKADLLQHTGGPADRPVRHLQPAVLDSAREPVLRAPRLSRGSSISAMPAASCRR